MKTYAGIGARATPPEMLPVMFKLGAELARKGWVLRSGGAKGADTAFERGARSVGGQVVVWRAGDAKSWAWPIAKKHHPAWNRCSAFVRNLMARSVHQVMGEEEVGTQSTAVIGWTPGGRGGGGTGQAYRIARSLGVPVLDLATMDRPFENVMAYMERVAARGG